MKIKKTSVNSSTCCTCDHKKLAMDYIRSAMDELALVEDDQISSDSIANLSVVLVDLMPCETSSTCNVPENADDMGTFTNDGMVD